MMAVAEQELLVEEIVRCFNTLASVRHKGQMTNSDRKRGERTTTGTYCYYLVLTAMGRTSRQTRT